MAEAPAVTGGWGPLVVVLLAGAVTEGLGVGHGTETVS
jgi:hypothetical protein